jgi:hypothetical protein
MEMRRSTASQCANASAGPVGLDGDSEFPKLRDISLIAGKGQLQASGAPILMLALPG